MNEQSRSDLSHNLVLPTLLFAALGGMTWAVRGCSGYGATPGCIFAGVAWGAAWWFIARDPSAEQSRRYSSGWIVLAVTVGLGIAGACGWMQWPSFFEGRLDTNVAKNESVPISRIYGFIWLFISGVPWAGLGACMLAWCGSLKRTGICHWILRIALGFGGMLLAQHLFKEYPRFFLPLYDAMESQYNDLEANPTLKRLINDCREAVAHMGFFLGFLLYEIIRRDWKNVVLISTVGLLNGIGWAACQNWKWAHNIWPDANFNWWRCWESSGGISIGVAYGVAYFLVNRPMAEPERTLINSKREQGLPAFESLLIFSGLAALFYNFLWFHIGGLTFLRLDLGDRTINFGSWSMYYFCTAIIVAVALCFRKSAAQTGDSHGGERSWRIDWEALVLGLAMLAGQYFHFKGQFYERNVYYGAVICLGTVYWMIRQRLLMRRGALVLPPEVGLDLQRFGLYLGVLFGLGLSIRNGLKGWFNIYKGNERYWDGVLWKICGPIFLLILIGMVVWMLVRPPARNLRGDLFPRAYTVMWLVLIVLNVLAQLVTGPHSSWNEVAFCIYYFLLFAIQAVIVMHYHSLQEERARLL